VEHADVAGWIMGALDPQEHRRFRAHLETCGECQQTVAEFAPTAHKLAAGLPGGELLPDLNPPEDLAERTLARVQQAASKARPREGSGLLAGGQAAPETPAHGPETPARGPETSARRQRNWRGARIISVAAAALVAAGAGVGIIVSQPAPALAFTIPLHGQHGSTASGQANAHQTSAGWSIQLTARHLKPLGPGQFYECWYTSRASRPGHPDLISAGTFTAGSGGTASVQMWSAADPRTLPIMQITVQSPGNGSRTGTVILTGTADR